ncbi:ATP-binding protein [Mesorhizobium australicum]|uniref:AlbA family DNA-binding domain-containing protein n=1 Tax=Mesorhizobium australicum TaxID=536018 RepID=UPI00333BA7AB
MDQITLDEIEALVTFQRSEGRTLDFKEAFPAGDHKGVRDFLADVTAFANTDGGAISLSACARTRTASPPKWSESAGPGLTRDCGASRISYERSSIPVSRSSRFGNWRGLTAWSYS